MARFSYMLDKDPPPLIFHLFWKSYTQPFSKDSEFLVLLAFLFCIVNYLRGSWLLFFDLNRPVGNLILMPWKEQILN